MFGWGQSNETTVDNNEYGGFTEEEFNGIELNHNAHIRMFRSALDLCKSSCLDKENESEQTYLNRREARCVDKCVGKFFRFANKIKELGDEHVKSKMDFQNMQ
ncbi:hypothetical protein K502DRAFT_338874 [Neoconidiobolus thromboides FSU 785]|nr:hypothetical protein K502DRAFT_338874 [Neoconidiobolus thromboides FSU 785]